jgi:hypothetical protein
VGEGTTGVEPRIIEREIEHLRTRLDRSLSELDRRRHELTDLRLQVRRHPRAVAGAGLAVFGLLGGVGFFIWRAAKKREELPQKARRLRISFARALYPPPMPRRDAPAWEKILAAVGTTLAVSLTKKLLDRAWNTRSV